MESFIDALLPISSSSEKCALLDCTAGKLYVMFAVVGVLGSVGSWGNFVAALVYEAILGLIIMRMCRGCHSRWPWVLLVLAAALPVILVVSFMIGALSNQF